MIIIIIMRKIIIDQIPEELGFRNGRNSYFDNVLCRRRGLDGREWRGSPNPSGRIQHKFLTVQRENINDQDKIYGHREDSSLTCNLEINNTPTEQLSRINYLGVEISSKRNVGEEVKNQVVKGARIPGCLYSLIWKNKYLSFDTG